MTAHAIRWWLETVGRAHAGQTIPPARPQPLYDRRQTNAARPMFASGRAAQPTEVTREPHR